MQAENIPQFSKLCALQKDLKDNKDNSLLGHYLYLVAHFLEQIMSTDKYPTIFSCQMATIVYIFLGSVIKSHAPCQLVDSKDNFACLVRPSRVFLMKKFTS